MSQMMRHRYNSVIPKVLKKLNNLFLNEKDIYICLAPYYYEFYSIWSDIEENIKQLLRKGSSYVLKFMWYLCFDFCEQIDSEKQY
jgi:hypothetical protein